MTGIGRGGKYRRWTAADTARLLSLVAGGKHWDDIALAMGRTAGACQQHYKFNKPAGVGRKRATRREVSARLQPAQLPVALHAPPTPPSGRQVSLHVLVADAELRARIALQGLTAGLFGDPLPGRSALDRKLAGDG